MTDLMKNFWPFAEWVYCVRCHQPVDTQTAIVVVDGDMYAGMAHEECPV